MQISLEKIGITHSSVDNHSKIEVPTMQQPFDLNIFWAESCTCTSMGFFLLWPDFLPTGSADSKWPVFFLAWTLPLPFNTKNWF